MDARAFVDTQGVNVHVYYDDTIYYNYPLLKAKVQELGMRHVRDGIDPSHRQWTYDRINDLAAAGIKSTLISCRIKPGGWNGLDADVADFKNKLRGALDGIEGTNEPDLTGISSWVNDTRGCQDWLYRLTRGDTYGAPLTVPIYEPSVTGDRYDELGAMSDRASGGNMHPYPGNQKPSGPSHYSFLRAMAESRQFGFGGAAVPVIASESGYHTAINHTGGHRPVSERAAGIYIPRMYFEYAKAGVARTFNYELFDLWPDAGKTNEQAAFGLYRNDGTAKPAARTIRNMNLLLDSPADSPRAALDYSISGTADPDGSGPRGAVKDMLMQKADGSYWLALWQDSSVWNGGDVSNASVTVSVGLPRTMNLSVYEPHTGTAPLHSATSSSFNTSVGDEVRLVKLTPSTSTSPCS